MHRLASLLILLPALLAPQPALALDHTSPKVRLGASAGVLGTLPLGSDVGQSGQSDEFERALWVHVDALTLDVGPYLSFSGFFRLVAGGGYNGDELSAALPEPELVVDADGQTGFQPGLEGEPESKIALIGLAARVFPFGHTRLRPFVSLGVGYATAGARFNVRSVPADAGGGGGSPFGGGGGLSTQTRRHKGLGTTFGVGVRFDPQVPAFGETWLLPVMLELSYVKNFWMALDESSLTPAEGALADEGMNLDFLGVLLTVGFLR